MKVWLYYNYRYKKKDIKSNKLIIKFNIFIIYVKYKLIFNI